MKKLEQVLLVFPMDLDPVLLLLMPGLELSCGVCPRCNCFGMVIRPLQQLSMPC